jgi:hydroxyquinol 1,2-dioxygenase
MSTTPTTDFTEETAAGAVVSSFRDTPDLRVREVLSSLVRHLHGFVREVELTQGEWDEAITFLTRTGQNCDEHRQEFILLSDVLGVSMLVDAINNRRPADVTSSTVLGPFHVVASPARGLGDSIAAGHVGGEPCVITGEVRSSNGETLGGALLDVWQANEAGVYDVQRPGEIPLGELRGLFTAAPDGTFCFRTIVPAPYPIPNDGPVGELLHATNRHPNRPAHIHLIAGAAGHDPVTTHMFVAGSPWLDSDAVFGVKQSLIYDFETVDDQAEADRYGVANPFRHAHFTIVLRATEP